MVLREVVLILRREQSHFVIINMVLLTVLK